MMNITHKTSISLTAAAAGLALAASSANAALLAIDINHSASPTETGFVGQNTSGVVHSTTAGNITVSWSGQQGTFDRGVPTTSGSNTDFYRDFIFENTTGNSPDMTLTLTGPGIASNTDYILTFYAFDSNDASRRTGFSGISGTTGTTLGPVVSQGTGDPDTLEEYAVTGTFTSDGSGNLTFGIDGLPNGSERTVLNGFQLEAVPEPSTTALLGLGGLALILRRRK